MSGRISHVSPGRHEVFEEISKKTGAFVKPPAYTDQVSPPTQGSHLEDASVKMHSLIADRRSFFGVNRLRLPPQRSIFNESLQSAPVPPFRPRKSLSGRRSTDIPSKRKQMLS